MSSKKPRKAVRRKPSLARGAVGEEILRGMATRGDPVTLLDASGKILYSSPEVTRLLGYEASEFEGGYAFDHVHPDDLPAIQRVYAELAAKAGEAVSVDVRCRRKDGSYRMFEVVGLNQLTDRSVGAIVATYRDVTERRELEQRAHGTDAAVAER